MRLLPCITSITLAVSLLSVPAMGQKTKASTQQRINPEARSQRRTDTGANKHLKADQATVRMIKEMGRPLSLQEHTTLKSKTLKPGLV